MSKNRTLDIKAAFSNQAHAILKDATLTAEQKLTRIAMADQETSDLLHNYWKNRKKKAKVQALRTAAGKPAKRKNKTTKEQWLAMSAKAVA